MTDVEAIRKRLNMPGNVQGEWPCTDIAALLADREAYRKRVREWAIYGIHMAPWGEDGRVEKYCRLCAHHWMLGEPERHQDGCPAAPEVEG